MLTAERLRSSIIEAPSVPSPRVESAPVRGGADTLASRGGLRGGFRVTTFQPRRETKSTPTHRRRYIQNNACFTPMHTPSKLLPRGALENQIYTNSNFQIVTKIFPLHIGRSIGNSLKHVLGLFSAVRRKMSMGVSNSGYKLALDKATLWNPVPFCHQLAEKQLHKLSCSKSVPIFLDIWPSDPIYDPLFKIFHGGTHGLNHMQNHMQNHPCAMAGWWNYLCCSTNWLMFILIVSLLTAEWPPNWFHQVSGILGGSVKHVWLRLFLWWIPETRYFSQNDLCAHPMDNCFNW